MINHNIKTKVQVSTSQSFIISIIWLQDNKDFWMLAAGLLETKVKNKIYYYFFKLFIKLCASMLLRKCKKCQLIKKENIYKLYYLEAGACHVTFQVI